MLIPSLLDLSAVVRACVDLSQLRHAHDAEAVHRASILCGRMMQALDDCARAGCTAADIAAVVGPARNVYAASPFARRLQEWPRGYPGDFETVEYILAGRNLAEPGTLAFGIEHVALASPIAQQHRNKVRAQADAILNVATARQHHARGARVLVLASGGAADVRMIEVQLVECGAHVVLVDQDAGALAFARDRLPRLAPRLTTVCRNVIRGLVAVRAHGPFDLVVAGGLFDYLPDEVIVRVLEQARERLLAPGGRVLFTNIAVGNPYRLWIESLASWHLIHRGADDVRQLCVGAGYAPSDVSVTSDPTGLALIARCAAGDARARESVGPEDLVDVDAWSAA